jgi:hypothetical protein
MGKRREKNTKLPLRIINYLREELVVPPKHSNKAHLFLSNTIKTIFGTGLYIPPYWELGVLSELCF